MLGMKSKEIARDVLALGSWVFFILVIARAAIKPYRPFLDQLIIAGIVLLIIGIFWKKANGYVARGIVLVVFTSIFYQSLIYTYFVILAGIALLWSSWYLEKDWRRIGYGLIVGAIGIGAGYYLSGVY
tara:strand:+ start:1670 stop:2053 length:384 start_codon:yes stop_codon:yes gene_type:complete